MSALHEDAAPSLRPTGQLSVDASRAMAFLERWTEGAAPRALLVSIVPDAPTTRGQTFDLPGNDSMARWIERSNRVAGIYWAVNTCRPALAKKATKADIDWLLAIWADLDTIKGHDLADERTRLHRLAEELMALPWPPTVVIGSGGGIQPLWRLEIPLEASHQEYRQAIEVLCRRIEATLGGVENTCNIDRVLRLPFTVNHPNRLKIAQGRVPVMSGILAETGRRYTWHDLESLAAHLEDEPVANATPVAFQPRRGNGAADASSFRGSSSSPLPGYPTDEQIEALLGNHPNLRPIWDQTTLHPPSDASPSGWDQSFASTLAAIGFPPEQIASYLRAYRKHHAPERGKQDRADYIWRTVQRADLADAVRAEESSGASAFGMAALQELGAAGNGSGQQRTASAAQGESGGACNQGIRANPTGDWPEPGVLGEPPPASTFPIEFLPQQLRWWVAAPTKGRPSDCWAVNPKVHQ